MFNYSIPPVSHSNSKILILKKPIFWYSYALVLRCKSLVFEWLFVYYSIMRVLLYKMGRVVQCCVCTVLLLLTMTEVGAQLTWNVSLGINHSQNLVDRKGNTAGAIDDDFHPSFGGQVNSSVGYHLGAFTFGTGIGVVFMNFFADKNSVFIDWFPGEERTDTRWTQWLLEVPINIEYRVGGGLPSLEVSVLNALNYQDPYDTFGIGELPYSLGLGLGLKHFIMDNLFGKLSYRYYGLENSWKPEKGSYFYPSIWCLDIGYRFSTE